MGRSKATRVTDGAPTASQPTGSMTVAMSCSYSHIAYVAQASLDEGRSVFCPTCGTRPGPGNGAVKMVRSVSDRFNDPTRSNHGYVPAPGARKEVRVNGRPQCDSCVMGDHGRCTGVGCFCRTSPVTRDGHMAGLVGRSL